MIYKIIILISLALFYLLFPYYKQYLLNDLNIVNPIGTQISGLLILSESHYFYLLIALILIAVYYFTVYIESPARLSNLNQNHFKSKQKFESFDKHEMLNSLKNSDLLDNIIVGHIQKNDKPKILIIDDMPLMFIALEHVLADEYECMFADKGGEGIKLALEENPNLIICNVFMQDENGYDVLHSLKNNPETKHLPVIIMQASDVHGSEYKSLHSLADGQIQKPIDEEQLRIHLVSILNKNEIFDEEVAIIIDDSSSCNKITKHDKSFQERFMKIIEENYADQCLQIEDIARKLNRCEKTVQNKIKSAIGISPMQYLWGYRLERAMELLLQTDISIGQVSDEVGFRSLQHFSSSFKLYTGMSPTEFRGCSDKNERQLS